MKNNKGFSIVELIVSFSICMGIVIILFQIVVVLKEVYQKSEVKTSLLNKQNILVDLVYSDILEKGLNRIETCSGNYCVIFHYEEESQTLSYSSSTNTFSYGEYTTPIVNGSIVGKLTSSTENGVVIVDLPVNHKLFSNQDFGIHIVHYLGS